MSKAICKKCNHFDKCVRDYNPYCDFYDPKEQTNEGWLCQLPTEEKAKFMCNIYEMGKNGKEYFMRLDKAVEWLKQPHT